MNNVDCNANRRFCSVCMEGKWCDHLSAYVKAGNDAWELEFGTQFEVPLQPSTGLWPVVRISSESIADICAPMDLLVEDLFTNETNEYPLGLWTKGEGLWSIRTVLLDWIKAKCGIERYEHIAQCPSSSHSPFKHRLDLLPPEQVLVHNWLVASYGLCIKQFSELAGITSALVPDAGDNSSQAKDTLKKLRRNTP